MKVLWAVDVFEEHPKAIDAMSRFLTALHAKVEIDVDAVSVVQGAKFPRTGQAKKMGRKLLKMRLGRVQAEEWFHSSYVLVENQIPQRVAVMDLIEFAQKGSYDAIAAVKHSRVAKKQPYLGSFAEMLTFLTPIPLYLVNPDGFVPKAIERLVLATDAGDESGRELQKLSRFLPFKGTEIRLHHTVPLKFSGWATRRDQTRHLRLRMKEASDALDRAVGIAVKLGSIAKASVKRASVAVEDSLLQAAAKERCDLIVLNHKGKGALGFFLGKITRRVLRNADRPVLLFREH